MQYFIGVVPPDLMKHKIIDIQKQWEHNSIIQVVEPHITLKAQGGLREDEKWLPKIIDICNKFPPIDITITGLDYFGSDILYLSPSSTSLVELHRRIIQAVSPSNELIKKYFELDDFVPHMTLGKTYYGLSKHELSMMAKHVEKELSPYPTFKVDYIRVYRETESNKYIKYLDIPLGL